MSSGGWLDDMISDEDRPWYMLAGCVAFPVIVAAVPGWRDSAVNWLVEWHVLAAASSDLLWTIPGGIGGFDGRRMVLAVILLLVAGVVAGISLRAHHLRAVDKELITGELNKHTNS